MANKDLNTLEQAFLEGPYEKFYRLELARDGLSQLDRINGAAIKGLSSRLKNMHSMSEGSAYNLISVLLIRSDIYNSRVLLRRLYRSKRTVMMPKWHDYGFIESSFFEEAWMKRDFMTTVEMCHSHGEPTSVALAHSVEVLQQTGSIVEAERSYLEEVVAWAMEVLKDIRGASSDLVLDYLRRLIDLWNMNIWLRKSHGSDRDDVTLTFIDGGRFLSFERLFTAKDLLSLFNGTPWKRALDLSDDFPPPELTRVAQKVFWRWQIDQRREDPLGIGVPMAYIARQLIEWRNIEILSVGLSANLAAEKIERLIFSL